MIITILRVWMYQSITLFVRHDINNTVTTKQSLEQDRQGTESALTVTHL